MGEQGGGDLWTAGGAYYVGIVIGSGGNQSTFISKATTSFNSASTTVAFSTSAFESVDVGGGGDTGTLTIQDIPANVFAYGQDGGNIGVFSSGTTPEQALSMTGLVAGGDLSNSDIIPNNGTYTVIVPLYNVTTERPWTENGAFAVFVALGDMNSGNAHFYSASSVTFSSGTATLSFNNATEVSLK
jgi:hypothetical protein